ncbi:MAG: hypothetical protein IJS52_11110 [Bacilli bacterium]|nr:hypothetical protein [Bacilli bacterium]
MNILVTGFKPWSTHGLNPSETAANFAANLGFPTHVFPVSYPVIDEAFFEKTFDAVLLFGLSATREEITLERYAYNEFDKTLLDVDGLCPDRDIIEPNGPKSLQTSLPVVALSDTLLSQGIPNHISIDPGCYLCNDAYFHALRRYQGKALFVHLPAFGEDFDESDLKRAVAILTEALKRQPSSDR